MMAGKGHALARDELIRVLTAYKGVTTSAGESDGTTLIDTNLIDNPSISASAVPEKTILITSGDAIMEDKGAASFDNATGTITLQGTGFSAQIKAGTTFRILNISSVEIDVDTINTKIGTNVDAAGTTTLFAWMAKIFAGDADIEAKLDSPAQGLAAIMATLAAVNAKLVDPATGLAAIMVTLGSISTRLDDPATGLAAISVTLSSVSGKLDDPASGLGALAASIAAVLSKLDNPANGLGAIMATLATHWNLFVDPAHGFAALANTLATTLTDVLAVEGKLDDGTSGLAALKALIDAAEAKLDRLAGSEADTEIANRNLNAGTPSSGAPNVGADILTITTTTRKKVHMLMVSMVNCTAAATISVRIYTKVNGVEVKFYDQDFTKDTDPDGIMAINGTLAILADLRVEMQSSAAGDTAVTIPYSYILEDME